MNIPYSETVFQAYPKVALAEFIPELAFEFQEMPEEALPNYVLRAITRLAREGNVIRRRVEVYTQPCVNNYILEPPDCMELVAVMGVCRLPSNHCGCVGNYVTRLTAHNHCQMPCGVCSWFESPNIIHFHPVNCGDIFSVEIAVAPTYDACEVDRIFLTQYYDVVMSGARAYLYEMAAKPWSSLNRAAEYEARFIAGIRNAAVETMMGGQRGAFRVQRPKIM